MATLLLRHREIPGINQLDVYKKHGGFGAFEKAVTTMKPQEVTDVVKASGLRGRGGAGFPTGVKWSFMPKRSVKNLPSRSSARILSMRAAMIRTWQKSVMKSAWRSLIKPWLVWKPSRCAYPGYSLMGQTHWHKSTPAQSIFNSSAQPMPKRP